jgi:hypothetical protein
MKKLRIIGHILFSMLLLAACFVDVQSAQASDYYWINCTIDGKAPYHDNGTPADKCTLIYYDTKEDVIEWFVDNVQWTEYANRRFFEILDWAKGNQLFGSGGETIDF